MSTEPVKKRGRPKKVLSDPVEVEMAESSKKVTMRSKSTTATKPATSKASSQKPLQTAKPVPKPVSDSPPTQKTAAKPSVAQQASRTPQPTIMSSKTTHKTPATPATSKILPQVRELSAKNSIPQVESTSPPISSTSNQSTKSQSTVFNKSTSMPSESSKGSGTPTSSSLSSAKPSVSKPSQPSPPNRMPQQKIPLASLNSQIVDNISTRAGARPNSAGSKNTLPPNYKPVARKVTMAIVAMPIAIVTSWVLYQRFVLGEERKLLVKPGLTMVETTGETMKTNEPSASA